VREDRVAALGSIPVPMTIAGRIAFQAQERLGKEGRTKIVDELAAKVPPVTEAERHEAEDGKNEFEERVAILLRAGWSTGDIVRANRLAELNDAEMAE
jgi:hypothetical protein